MKQSLGMQRYLLTLHFKAIVFAGALYCGPSSKAMAKTAFATKVDNHSLTHYCENLEAVRSGALINPVDIQTAYPPRPRNATTGAPYKLHR